MGWESWKAESRLLGLREVVTQAFSGGPRAISSNFTFYGKNWTVCLQGPEEWLAFVRMYCWVDSQNYFNILCRLNLYADQFVLSYQNFEIAVVPIIQLFFSLFSGNN